MPDIKNKPLNPSPRKRKQPTELTESAYQVTRNIDNRFDAVVNELFASIHATPVRAKLEQKIRELQEEIICTLQEGI